MSKVKKILFVCTGNSCRSVMAEGLLRQRLERIGRSDIHVMSAGTHAVPGLPPTPQTIETMRSCGVDVSQHQSQPLSPELVRHADVIFCMEGWHLDCVVAMDPKAKEKTFLLVPFGRSEPVENPNVPDPIGMPLELYDACRMTLEDAVDRIIKWLTGETSEMQQNDPSNGGRHQGGTER